jgi:outer membrane protein assembly factor BamB
MIASSSEATLRSPLHTMIVSALAAALAGCGSAPAALDAAFDGALDAATAPSDATLRDAAPPRDGRPIDLGDARDASFGDGALADGAPRDQGLVDFAALDAPAPVDATPPVDAPPGDAAPAPDAAAIDAAPVDGEARDALDSGVTCALDGAVKLQAPVTVWTVKGQNFEGSATVCDLDHNGHPVALLPMSAGAHFMIAVDAVTGQLRWQTAQEKAGYSYPYCVDVNGDGVDDVLTGGKINDLIALDGKSGALLWSLAQNYPGITWGHTYSVAAAAVDDPVLFVTTGGADAAFVTGVLVAFDKQGNVLGTWTNPDLQESYSSPAVLALPDGRRRVAFGTGGEKLAGSLHLVDWYPVAKRFVPVGEIPATCGNGGVISSPMFGDVDGDGEPDVVFLDYCGTTTAAHIDGNMLWRSESPVLYGTSNPLLVDLNHDGALDVVAAFESLDFSLPDTFANLRSVVQARDGKSGSAIWTWSTPGLIFNSPVSVDIDLDGVEDIFVVPLMQSQTIILSGATGLPLLTLPLGDTSATPFLGDFDGDCVLDAIVYDDSSAPGLTKAGALRLTFPGVPAVIGWSGFRGAPRHDGYRRSP